MQLILTVEEIFDTSLGAILLPGLKEKVTLVETGKRIILIYPDRTKLETIIKGIQFQGDHNLLLPKGLNIPIGTEVWV